VAILLECDSLQRTRLQGLEGKFLINIDHHIGGRPFAHVNWIDPEACATAELVYRLRVSAAPPLLRRSRRSYTGLVADTGSFMFDGTNEHTFALARELVLAGAAPARSPRTFISPTPRQNALARAALSNLHREGDLAWSGYARPDGRVGALDEDCEGLVNYALAIQGVEVAAFFSRTGRRPFSASACAARACGCNRSCRHVWWRRPPLRQRLLGGRAAGPRDCRCDWQASDCLDFNSFNDRADTIAGDGNLTAPRMSDTQGPRQEWIVLAVVCGFLFFYGLGAFGLVERMNRAMPRWRGNARTQRLGHATLGHQPWLEKPPLLYWEEMIAFPCWRERLGGAPAFRFLALLMIVAIYCSCGVSGQVRSWMAR